MCNIHCYFCRGENENVHDLTLGDSEVKKDQNGVNYLKKATGEETKNRKQPNVEILTAFMKGIKDKNGMSKVRCPIRSRLLYNIKVNREYGSGAQRTHGAAPLPLNGNAHGDRKFCTQNAPN